MFCIKIQYSIETIYINHFDYCKIIFFRICFSLYNYIGIIINYIIITFLLYKQFTIILTVIIYLTFILIRTLYFNILHIIAIKYRCEIIGTFIINYFIFLVHNSNHQ